MAAKIITIGSLSGGQGKSTLSLFLARYLASLNHTVFLVDCDPQGNSTQYLGCKLGKDSPTLLEVLRGVVEPLNSLIKVGHGLYGLPATEDLNCAVEYIANCGAGAGILRRRLSGLLSLANYIIIDTPPARSHLSLAAYAAADVLYIPAETNDKGVGSVHRTIKTINELAEVGVFRGQVAGIIPFRQKWVGAHTTLSSRTATGEFERYGAVLPAIIESEGYKKALLNGGLPSDMGVSDYPLQYIARMLEAI